MRSREALTLLTGVAMLALTAVAAGAPLAAAAATDSPDVIEVRHYALTLDKAEKTANAIQIINKLTASNPALKAKMDASSAGNLPITEQAKNIDANFPEVAAIIHANGLATREFIVITGAVINDVMVVGMKKQGIYKEYPPGSITPANAALVEQNWDKFEAIGNKMMPDNSR
jgi:ABC-type glycerol-3-phosphate transport system substrate-binding protein